MPTGKYTYLDLNAAFLQCFKDRVTRMMESEELFNLFIAACFLQNQ